MKNNIQKHTPESIQGFVSNFQKSRALLTAFELGIFTSLDSGPRTSAAVAGEIGTDPRATDRLMNAVCALGFLEKKDHKFSNTEDSGSYFVKGKPGYMAGLMHQVSLWDTWSTLTASVRTGASAYKRPQSVNDRDQKWLDAFIGAMHYRGMRQAPEIIAKIDLAGVKKVLDVGGGSGVFAMAFANAGAGISCTVFDLPNVVTLAKKYIHEENMEKKVDTFTGDFDTDSLPGGYDIAFVSAIVHSLSYEGNVQLIDKCGKSLNTGGRIVIQDFVMNEERTDPGNGALFALNMLVGTRDGDTYTEKEIREWFEKAGIRFEKRIDTLNGNALIIGRKPE
jgi:2-polyprenyl-3-methyl-5-hydroxy-6-metoxy-1,4-benzoquinol methylase